MFKKVLWGIVPLLALTGVIGLMVWAAGFSAMPILNPKGSVASAERKTLYVAIVTMLIVVVPVFVLTFVIALRYRATNHKAKYTPDWASSKKLEFIWWGVPICIVSLLSVLAWQTSHSLDPYKALASNKKAVEVQVVALQWKWLFIYPDYKIASVNELAIPVDTPVDFTITSDAPMNSFWIPQLGGQIYAMAGMSTKLHLDATSSGDYRGVSANLSGKGHADMKFIVKARTDADFQAWLKKAQLSQTVLDQASYEVLRKAGTVDRVSYYQLGDTELYDSVINRYSEPSMNGMHMEGSR